ncbi:MAG: ribosomal protein S18-alanine N-acetyltransferase [Vagococcus sp.]|uniref:ribosomal protein S18-alanine N-acetyltransferase n=1 Tax=Vagococcus sp. TaxID=1933889 RepID=UPI002FCAEB25
MKRDQVLLSDDKLAQQCVEISKASFETASPWNKEQFLASFSAKNQQVFLTIEQKEVVSFIVISTVLDEAEIELIAVDNWFKRRGYGKSLLNEVLCELEKNEVKDIFLEVRESNLAAQKFYRFFGFQEIGRRKNYYQHPKEDGLMFKLSI